MTTYADDVFGEAQVTWATLIANAANYPKRFLGDLHDIDNLDFCFDEVLRSCDEEDVLAEVGDAYWSLRRSIIKPQQHETEGNQL